MKVLMDQDLFTHARHKRELGIERSARKAGEDWKSRSADWLHEYLLTHCEFISDDLWEAGLEQPPSMRGLGALIQYAVQQGWVEDVRHPDHEDWVCCRPSVRSNMAMKRVWRSMITNSTAFQ